jgi:hypothetical protein
MKYRPKIRKEAALSPLRRGLGTRAGGFTRFMGSGDQGVRRFERRWAPRYRFHADLEIEWGSSVLRARTRDISSSGMFIESDDPLWVGAGFSAQLTLDKPVKLNCSVKRIEPGRGMGVSFALAEEHRETLQELINHLSGNP